jgi:hypothetical protein
MVNQLIIQYFQNGVQYQKDEFQLRSNLNNFIRAQGIAIGSDEYMNIFKPLLNQVKRIQCIADLMKFQIIEGLTTVDEMKYQKKVKVKDIDYYYFDDESCLRIDYKNERIYSNYKIR